MQETEPRTRGLNAIQEARQRRGRPDGVPARFWPWLAGVLAVWGIVYWYVTDTQLDRAKHDLLTRQRAAAADTLPRWQALRSQIGTWVFESAGAWDGDRVSDSARTSKFRERPGIYLRLHMDDARDPRRLEASAVDSLRDGFTSCFARADNPDPFQGPACNANHDCPSGQHCDQAKHCSVPAQPFNLRVAYRGARVLSDEWAHEVALAGDDMRMRYLERDFDSATRDDLPLAVELLNRAEYFMVVLDEPAARPVEVPPGKTQSEALQAVSHPVRVAVYDLKTRSLLLRVREQVAADVGISTSDPELSASVLRQANNCALALSVAQKLGDVVASSE